MGVCYGTCFGTTGVALKLNREQKSQIVDAYRTHNTDTGSPEVQIAILSERISRTDRRVIRGRAASRRRFNVLPGRTSRAVDKKGRRDQEPKARPQAGALATEIRVRLLDPEGRQLRREVGDRGKEGDRAPPGRDLRHPPR